MVSGRLESKFSDRVGEIPDDGIEQNLMRCCGYQIASPNASQLYSGVQQLSTRSGRRPRVNLFSENRE